MTSGKLDVNIVHTIALHLNFINFILFNCMFHWNIAFTARRLAEVRLRARATAVVVVLLVCVIDKRTSHIQN